MGAAIGVPRRRSTEDRLLGNQSGEVLLPASLPSLTRMKALPMNGQHGSGMKEMSRFRIMERPGSMIGICSLHNESALFPYRVQATKYSRTFYIALRELRQAMGRMTSLDEHACRAAVKMEHHRHV